MKKRKILLIDDEPAYMTFYVEALKDRDFEVKLVSKVDEVEATIKFFCPDLVVVDIMMGPGESLKDKQTKGGLLTGKFLLATIPRQMPRVVLTNVDERKYSDSIPARFYHKLLWPAIAFSREVEAFFQQPEKLESLRATTD